MFSKYIWAKKNIGKVEVGSLLHGLNGNYNLTYRIYIVCYKYLTN